LKITRKIIVIVLTISLFDKDLRINGIPAVSNNWYKMGKKENTFL